MPFVRADESLLLPERARLLHIGPMKTGTTSLQSAASGLRRQLLAHGVRYPGVTMNHRRAVGAFMNKAVSPERRTGAVGERFARDTDAAVPPRHEWDDLMHEVEADTTRRIWISHEFVAEASKDRAREFADALGNRTHVVITLRHPASILASQWTQRLKSGHIEEFGPWLERVFDRVPEQRMRPQFRRSQSQGALVDRWAKTVGPKNVTAIVVDRERPNLVFDAFESMLGLPHGMLSSAPLDGLGTNRSMSLPEAELVLEVNRAVREEGVDWKRYSKLVRNGAIAGLLENRQPAADEQRVALPEWAADEARKRGRKYARRIAASGVRIVGDLTSLHAPVNPGEQAEPEPGTYLDVATRALMGMLAATDPAAAAKPSSATTSGRAGLKTRALAAAARLIRVADTHTTYDLAKAAKQKVRRRR